jgi:FAD/FMN-containing dehydrogenase
MTTTAQPTQFDELKLGMRGPVIQPGDDSYDLARAVYNAMIDRRPAAIARCADVADVITAVRFAAGKGLTVSVRGGGHNAGGLGVWDDALVIDLSAMRGIRVDPATKTVRAQGGCVWGDVDHATHAFGLATPSGILGTTGVGGLTLGGGTGHLTRRYGLTVDNLLSADVVLADGSFVTASDDAHPDLFWALRGGGGNFGVVTSFEFRCHDIDMVVAGPVFYDIADTTEVLRWYREVEPGLPEELNGWFALLTIPPVPPFPEALWLRKVCGILWCYSGPAERAEQALAPVRGFGSPLLDAIQPMPYPILQGMFDALYPPGLQWYWRADFFNEIPDAAVAVHQKFGEALPTPYSTMHLYPIDGAVHRVGTEATAFAYRNAGWNGVIVGVDPDPASAGAIKDWTVSYWEALHPTSAGGAYVNFMMDEGTDRVRASYGPNYDRLARIKASYDPGNFFRVNQNILPAS